MEFEQWMKHLSMTLEDYRFKAKQDSMKRLSAETEIEGGWAFVESVESLEDFLPGQVTK